MNQTMLPKEWKIVSLGDCCQRPEYGLTTSASNIPSQFKLLRITDIQDNGVDWERVPYCESTEGVKESHRLLPGDIVVARIGATTGKAYLIRECPDAVFASYLIRIRTKPELSPEYLGVYLQTAAYWKHIDKNKGGRLKGGVSIPILQDLSLPLPPLPEQRAIARVLRAVQKARELRQREILAFDKLFRAMLEKLMTGKLSSVPLIEKE